MRVHLRAEPRGGGTQAWGHQCGGRGGGGEVYYIIYSILYYIFPLTFAHVVNMIIFYLYNYIVVFNLFNVG